MLMTPIGGVVSLKYGCLCGGWTNVGFCLMWRASGRVEEVAMNLPAKLKGGWESRFLVAFLEQEGEVRDG